MSRHVVLEVKTADMEITFLSFLTIWRTSVAIWSKNKCLTITIRYFLTISNNFNINGSDINKNEKFVFEVATNPENFAKS